MNINIVRYKIFSVTFTLVLHLSGANDGWYAGFWEDPLGSGSYAPEPKETLQSSEYKLHFELHEGEKIYQDYCVRNKTCSHQSQKMAHYYIFFIDVFLQEPPGANHRDLMLQEATQCVSHLIKIAATKRRNYILDQVIRNMCELRLHQLSFHSCVLTFSLSSPRPTFIHLPSDTRCSVSVVTSEERWWFFHLTRCGGDVSYSASRRRAWHFRR